MICCAILHSLAESFISSPPYTHIIHCFVKVHTILTAVFLWIGVHLDPDRHPLVYLPPLTLYSVAAHANTHTVIHSQPSFAHSLSHSYTWRRMHTRTQYRCELWCTTLLTQPNRNMWKDTFFFSRSFSLSFHPSLYWGEPFNLLSVDACALHSCVCVCFCKKCFDRQLKHRLFKIQHTHTNPALSLLSSAIESNPEWAADITSTHTHS